VGEGYSAILDIIEQVVRDLEYTLADNVLGGPAKQESRQLPAMATRGRRGWRRCSLDAKLESFEAFGEIVHQLLLDGSALDGGRHVACGFGWLQGIRNGNAVETFGDGEVDECPPVSRSATGS
jgi:hypothetical protein